MTKSQPRGRDGHCRRSDRTDLILQSYRYRARASEGVTRKILLRVGMQNPAGWGILTSEAIETGPVEPVPLTPAQPGVPTSARDLATKAIQSAAGSSPLHRAEFCTVHALRERAMGGEVQIGHAYDALPYPVRHGLWAAS
jgi:hypothetical protein